MSLYILRLKINTTESIRIRRFKSNSPSVRGRNDLFTVIQDGFASESLEQRTPANWTLGRTARVTSNFALDPIFTTSTESNQNSLFLQKTWLMARLRLLIHLISKLSQPTFLQVIPFPNFASQTGSNLSYIIVHVSRKLIQSVDNFNVDAFLRYYQILHQSSISFFSNFAQNQLRPTIIFFSKPICRYGIQNLSKKISASCIEKISADNSNPDTYRSWYDRSWYVSGVLGGDYKMLSLRRSLLSQFDYAVSH